MNKTEIFEKMIIQFLLTMDKRFVSQEGIEAADSLDEEEQKEIIRDVVSRLHATGGIPSCLDVDEDSLLELMFEDYQAVAD